MNCAEFEDRLNEDFDASQKPRGGRLGTVLSADLAEHAGECETCRGLSERLQLLADCLGVWRDQIPEIDLTEAVMSAHRRPSTEAERGPAADSPVAVGILSAGSRRRALPRLGSPGLSSRVVRRRAVWLAMGSLVAIAAFALLVPGLGLVGPQSVPGPHMAVKPAGQNQDSAIAPRSDAIAARSNEQVKDGADSVDPVLDQAQIAYRDLAQKAAGALDEVAMFVRPLSSESRARAEPGGEKGTGWIDGLQHQLKPIGRSLDDAFDFLWQAGESADPSKT
jgi:hypothetical protein